MAKNSKKRGPRIQKFINYTREAFFWPFHLGIFATLTLGAVAGMAFADTVGIDPISMLMIFGGLELTILGAISQNNRFIRAINAKYQKDIDAYYKTKTLVEYYNSLSYESQARFNMLKEEIQDIRDGYKKIQTSAPELVNRFLVKLNSIETSYVRLLYYKDKFPELASEEIMHKTTREMDNLIQEIKDSSGRVKTVKEKRLRLLKMRMDNYSKVSENRAVIEEQLQTIEEMVEYIKDQPMTLQNTDREDIMIDNLLFETEQTQETLEELESLMRSEFAPELSTNYDDYGYDSTGRMRE